MQGDSESLSADSFLDEMDCGPQCQAKLVAGPNAGEQCKVRGPTVVDNFCGYHKAKRRPIASAAESDAASAVTASPASEDRPLVAITDVATAVPAF